MQSKSKLLIIGHARHGKDTAAEFLRDNYGFTLADSSRRSLEIFLYDKLKAKYGYNSVEECYLDRVNHRAEWYEEIKAYNTPDKTKLARNIMADSDIYVGMRSSDEIEACREAQVFHRIIWVDASARLPLEDKSSFNIAPSIADIVIDNNGHISRLESQLKTLWESKWLTQ